MAKRARPVGYQLEAIGASAIGASAGGIDALSIVLASLPDAPARSVTVRVP